ncbi:MAG: hypothetical protein HY727_15180 [Candidatus Rokubacteria bacterium]|nr:hypothetical protein [Candidatus Rokubacteria bacterium]
MAQPTVSRWKRGQVAAKIETTYGTDAVLAAADLIEVRNIVFRVTQEQFRDERISGAITDLPDIPGARSAVLSFEALLRGAAVAYSASVKPEVDALLRACGLAATGSFGVGTEKWDYKPQSAATIGESVTAALFVENAPQGKLLGAFGTARFMNRVGQPAVLAVTLTGLYVAPADIALLTGTISTVQPPVFKSGAVTVAAYTPRVASFDVDLGNDVQLIQSANDAQGVAGVLIAWRRLLATLDPEAVTVATFDWHNKRDLGTLLATTWQVGTTQYNRIKYNAPKLQVLDITDIQRNGLRAYQIAAKLNANTGGDELTITAD